MKPIKNSYDEKDLAIGAVYKRLRCAKGFSQKEAAGSEISCNHLSSFENGHTILATNHFLVILRNIGTNMYEFQYMYNDYLRHRDILLYSSDVEEAYRHQNIVQLKIILEQIKASLVMTPYIKKLRLDKIHIEVILSLLDTSFIPSQNEINYLKQYLSELKEWGQYDIFLLGHCSPAIDSYSLYELATNLIKPTQAQIDLHYIKLALIQTILNVIGIFIDREMYPLANEFIVYLEKSHISDIYMYEKFTLVYNTLLNKYKQGDSSALTMLKKCQEILIFCNCLSTANLVQQEISELDINDND